ncbi:unnamed protein product [Effrenium voratum]|nr:unnamed protein product [Effrenium voratum]
MAQAAVCHGSQRPPAAAECDAGIAFSGYLRPWLESLCPGELREAVAKLREELAASAAERVRLALEECEQPGKLLNLPWRSLFTPQDLELPLWVGDYCMPDESHSAARERLGQLLCMPEEALSQAPEHLDEHIIFTAKHAGTYSAKELEKPAAAPAKPQQKAPLAVCLGLVVLLVAVAIPRLL